MHCLISRQLSNSVHVDARDCAFGRVLCLEASKLFISGFIVFTFTRRSEAQLERL